MGRAPDLLACPGRNLPCHVCEDSQVHPPLHNRINGQGPQLPALSQNLESPALLQAMLSSKPTLHQMK